MLTDKQVLFLREELATAKNPLFFYDGDGDGLASFLLLYRINREGKGIALRTSSRVDELSLRKISELNPDKVFVLDIPMMTKEFMQKVKRPVFWIDHHPVQEVNNNIHYFNPRIKDPDAYIPTSRMAWQVSDNEEDLWIATAGCLADWYMPNFINKFIEKYPRYLSKKKDLPKTVFKSQVGKLVKLLFFLQKGPTSELRKSMKILTRIKSPDEIFQQTTPAGKFLFKRFKGINKMYEELLTEAKKGVTRSKVLVFYYSENKWSFTANLANELMARYQKKMIIITRKKSGEMKCSLRGKNILKYLQQALEGIEGRGGGHPDACGAAIKEEDWEIFLERFKGAMKK